MTGRRAYPWQPINSTVDNLHSPWSPASHIIARPAGRHVATAHTRPSAPPSAPVPTSATGMAEGSTNPRWSTPGVDFGVVSDGVAGEGVGLHSLIRRPTPETSYTPRSARTHASGGRTWS